MKHLKTILAMVVAVLLFSVCCVPALAADDHIKISTDGSGGIKIEAGEYPDMTGGANGAQEELSKQIVSKGKQVGQTITAICAIVCLVFFFINVTKLATSGSISFQRRAAITGLLWSGGALILFGGSWVVISFFWNFLSTT